MKQCINGKMRVSRKAFNKLMNSWYTQQDQIPLQQISFMKTTIFDFMYKSVAQCYESTDMYQNIKRISRAGANATSGANATLNKLIFEQSTETTNKPTEEQLKERKKPDIDYKDLPNFFIDHRNNNTDTKKDTRDIDMLRNLAYLKMNPTYIKKLRET